MTVDHAAIALSRLPIQFRGKEKIEAYLAALAAEGQEVWDAQQQLLTLKSIEDGEGVQLDGIGDIVGQRRDGVDDDTYKSYLFARVATNHSGGALQDILRIARIILGPDGRLTANMLGIAALEIVYTGATADDDTVVVLVGMLEQAVVAGVRIVFEYSTAEDDDTFTTGITAFVSGAHFAGLSSLPVAAGDAAPFPPDGTIVIDVGLATEEEVDYLSRTADAFELDGLTTQAHSDRSEVTLRPPGGNAGSLGRGFAHAAFLDGAIAAPTSTITVHAGNSLTFPTDGTLLINPGLADEELFAYTSRDATSFTGPAPTTLNHDDGSEVVLVAVDDSTNPNTYLGGQFASAVE